MNRAYKKLALTALAVICAAPWMRAQGSGSGACADLAKLQLPMVSIARAERVPASAPGMLHFTPTQTVAVAVPAFCRVDGVIEPRTGADGKAYGIGFALALPETWNGDFEFQGGGGLNGTVQLPLGERASGGNPGLARGYAVVSTDSGHKGAGFDGSFFADQQATIDFYYAAIGRVALTAKDLIARFYGRPAGHSYYVGCSTGGREAMIMSQRYPGYFDGIVSGDPAIRTGHSNLGLAFIEATFNAAAPKDDGGKPQPKLLFSDGDRKLITGALLKACDAKDGIEDGLIFNPKACDFDPAKLVCAGAKADDCLTAQQAAALKKAFGGPKDLRGSQIYPGFPWDAGMADKGAGIPGLLHGPVIPVAPPSLATEFDADAAEANVLANATALLGDSTWTNLSSFSGHGGKLIFYHGLSDPWFSPLDTINYYEKMSRENGGMNKVASWSRLYLVPGMGHCGGGSATLDNFDMLSAITNWVEKGTAPESVVATGKAFPGRSRPLCVYPSHAQYSGQGDPNDAKNFVCRAD